MNALAREESYEIRARFPADVKQVARTADESRQRSHGFKKKNRAVLKPLFSTRRKEKKFLCFLFPWRKWILLDNSRTDNCNKHKFISHFLTFLTRSLTDPQAHSLPCVSSRFTMFTGTSKWAWESVRKGVRNIRKREINQLWFPCCQRYRLPMSCTQYQTLHERRRRLVMTLKRRWIVTGWFMLRCGVWRVWKQKRELQVSYRQYRVLVAVKNNKQLCILVPSESHWSSKVRSNLGTNWLQKHRLDPHFCFLNGR